MSIFRIFNQIYHLQSTISSYIIISILIIDFIINPIGSIRWLGIYRLPKSADHPLDSTAERFTTTECHKASNELGLKRKQMKFCLHPRFGYAMIAILRAAHAVGYHCPKTFSDRRWNCTSIHQLPHISPELKRGTREQALVHAFASAALLFEIGHYCAQNKIRYCSCGDDSGIYAQSNLPINNHNSYNNFGNALVYNSVNNEQSITGESLLSNTNSVPMTDGQPTVSKFYWAGCSDNLRIAREYTSLFLGFPNIEVPIPPPFESDETNAQFSNDLNQNRYKRTTYNSKNLITTTPYLKNLLKVSRNNNNNNDVGNYHTESSVDEEVDYDDDGDDDGDFDTNIFFDHINDRQKRNLNYPASYYSHSKFYSDDNTDANNNPHTIGNSISQSHNQYPDQRWPRRPRSRQRKSKPSIIKILNKHNYLAGVVLMEANQKLVCKCHGVSGSCAQRVCFRQLRRIDTEVMQKALKMRYLAAKQVSEGRNQELIAKTFTGNGFVDDEVVKPEELVFSEHSPDYCNVEPKRGSVGTRDRLCTLKDPGTANCVNMCCGRGYRNVTKREVIQCNCRMSNGFKVQCDECEIETIKHRCL